MVPVITTTGVYQTVDGTIHNYEDSTDYSDMLETYFSLDYANVKQKDFIKDFVQ
jgi:hypothetical protein